VAGLREAVLHARAADARDARAPNPSPGDGAFGQLLRDVERAGLPVFLVARAVVCSEYEVAMIMQVAAPPLAGMTPGNVLRRHKLAE
jgi:hypothetical protein